MQLKRVLTASVAGAAMVVAMAGAAQTASAAAAPKGWSCATGFLCVYDKPNGKTPLAWKESDCGLYLVPSNIGLLIDSARNRTGSPVHFFKALTGTVVDNFESLQDQEKSTFDPSDANSTGAIFIECS